MTPSLKPMETFLNLHAHRPAASSSETVIRNYILPLPPAGHEEPEYGQAFSAGIHPWYIPAHPEETLKELDITAAAVCIIHGFRGIPKLAESLLGKGFYLSFGFRFHPQSLTLCPSDRLFFESDEDSRPVDTLYRTAAELRSCTPEELRTQCWENLVRIGPSSKK